MKNWEGFTDRLHYAFDPMSIIFKKENGKEVEIKWKDRSRPRFDAATKTITIPIVDDNKQVTRRVMSYKFNGTYFELVKS